MTWTSGETITASRLEDKADRNLSGQYAGIAGAPLSSGGIVFANSSGALTGDSNLFWDNTNKRLGLSTSAPTSKITVISNTTYDGNEVALHAVNIITGIAADDHQLHMGADKTNDLAYIQSTGNQDFKTLLLQGKGGGVTIGTTSNSPGTNNLYVCGNVSALSLTDRTNSIGKTLASTYVGNNTVNRAIPHGLGKLPQRIMINDNDGAYNRYVLASRMIWEHPTLHGTIDVNVWDTTNFYVGNATDYNYSGNANGTIYHWVAMG